jgi:RNA polymerase sigma-70 factor (ECF subfamily)
MDMEDAQILELIYHKDNAGISELNQKYSGNCFKIAWNILGDYEDSEECVNDTWLYTRYNLSSNKPVILGAFVTSITRSMAIDCLRKKGNDKNKNRSPYKVLHMEEIEKETENLNHITAKILTTATSEKELYDMLNHFLEKLSASDRDIFLRRYWYMDKLEAIAERHDEDISSIKSSLNSSRKMLYKFLLGERKQHG